MLQLGLSICPTENIDIFESIKDLHLFARKICLRVLLYKSKNKDINYVQLFKEYLVQDFIALKDFIILVQESTEISRSDQQILEMNVEDFIEKSTNIEQEKPCYKPKSKVFPSMGLCPSVATFVDQVTTTSINKLACNKSAHNLEPRLRTALKHLTSNHNLVIKPADKGGNTVVMSLEEYNSMCQKPLDNEEWYGKTPKESLDTTHLMLCELINHAFHSGIIDQSTKEYLLVPFPRVAIFYSLPKLHNRENTPTW